MKRIPLWPVGKGLGVCSRGVLKQPQTLTKWGFFLPTPQIIEENAPHRFLCSCHHPWRWLAMAMLPLPRLGSTPTFCLNKQRKRCFHLFFCKNYDGSFFANQNLKVAKLRFSTDFSWIFLLVGPFVDSCSSLPLLPLTFQPWVLFLSVFWDPPGHRCPGGPEDHGKNDKKTTHNSRKNERLEVGTPKKIWLVFCIDMVCCFSFFPRDLNFRFQAVEGVGRVRVCCDKYGSWMELTTSFSL